MTSDSQGADCPKCGAGVSVFVTECPYCGARLRERAPDLERRGEQLAPTELPRVRRRPRLPRIRMQGAERPWASIVTVAAGALSLLVLEALGEGPVTLGAVASEQPASEPWRYLAAPFVYGELGYLFVCACAILIFGSGIESRVGTVLTAFVIIACGCLGLLLGLTVEDAVGSAGLEIAWGGNAVALGLLSAWATITSVESRRNSEIDNPDPIGPVVCAGVLVLLSVVVGPANIFVGLAGAVVGAVSGFVIGIASGGSTSQLRRLS